MLYNKYFDDNGMFSYLYRPVESSEEPCAEQICEKPSPPKRGLDIKRLLSRLDIEKAGLLPVILLLLLLLDVDDEEKLIIIALAVVFGI